MNERNITLDWLKILLSIFVVCAHAPYLFAKGSILNWYFSPNGFALMTVPVFFIVNGYFFQPFLSQPQRVRKYIFKMLTLYVAWSIIYIPIYYGESSWRVIALYLVTGYIHLWYLAALLFSVSLIFVLSRKVKSSGYMLLIAIVVYLLFRSVDPISMLGKAHSHLLFVLDSQPTGFLFVSLGCFIRDKCKLDRLDSRKLILGSVVSFILFLILLYPSFNFTGRIFMVKGLMLPIVSLFIFLTAMRLAVYRESKGYVKYLSNISAGIYFMHVYFLLKLYPFFQDDKNLIHVLFVVAICALLSIAIAKIKWIRWLV